MTLVPKLKSPRKIRKTTKKWPICFAQIYIVQIQNDMATIFPFKHAFLKVSFPPSGIEGQNEPFKRSVVAKLME